MRAPRPPPYSTSNEGAAAARRLKGERAALQSRQQRLGISAARRMAREAQEAEMEHVRARAGVHRGVVLQADDGSLYRLFPGDPGYAESKAQHLVQTLGGDVNGGLRGLYESQSTLATASLENGGTREGTQRSATAGDAGRRGGRHPASVTGRARDRVEPRASTQPRSFLSAAARHREHGVAAGSGPSNGASYGEFRSSTASQVRQQAAQELEINGGGTTAVIVSSSRGD